MLKSEISNDRMYENFCDGRTDILVGYKGPADREAGPIRFLISLR